MENREINREIKSKFAGPCLFHGIHQDKSQGQNKSAVAPSGQQKDIDLFGMFFLLLLFSRDIKFTVEPIKHTL